MTYQQFPVPGPFQGHVDNMPPPHTPASAFDEIVNFICRKGRVQTRPRMIAFGSPPDGAIIRLLRTYADIENNLHTLCLTTQTAYAITAGPVFNELTLPAGIDDLSGTALPYGWVTINNRIYFSNGSRRILYVDGSANVLSSNADFTARYLTVNAEHLIAVYLNDLDDEDPDTAFPYRVRWSKSGDPNDWTAFGSGSNDLLSVPDITTGVATLGRNTLIFRTNGMTLMTPTGNGSSPFTFENGAFAPEGVGNNYPYSLAVFDKIAVFVSSQDIYTIDSGLTVNPIGGKAKKKIFSQLAGVSGDVVSSFIISKLGPGIDFLSYWLVIPGQSTWIYHWDQDAWTEFAGAEGRPTFVGPAIVT